MNQLVLVVIASASLIGVILLTVLMLRHRKQLRNLDHSFRHQLQNLRYALSIKIHSIEKEMYLQKPGAEVLLYDSRKEVAPNDFHGKGAQDWDYTAHRFLGQAGTGTHQVQATTISINRTNTEGRYELHLRKYSIDGLQTEEVPAIGPTGHRVLKISFEVKKIGSSRVLRFVFKGKTSQNVLDEKEYVVYSPEWEQVDLHFSVSGAEACALRIDDLYPLHQPGGVQLRNIVLMEKKML